MASSSAWRAKQLSLEALEKPAEWELRNRHREAAAGSTPGGRLKGQPAALPVLGRRLACVGVSVLSIVSHRHSAHLGRITPVRLPASARRPSEQTISGPAVGKKADARKLPSPPGGISPANQIAQPFTKWLLNGRVCVIYARPANELARSLLAKDKRLGAPELSHFVLVGRRCCLGNRASTIIKLARRAYRFCPPACGPVGGESLALAGRLRDSLPKGRIPKFIARATATTGDTKKWRLQPLISIDASSP